MTLLILRGDKLRLHDGREVEVIDAWGMARSHAKVKGPDGVMFAIIAERDVDAVLKRPAIRESKFKEW